MVAREVFGLVKSAVEIQNQQRNDQPGIQQQGRNRQGEQDALLCKDMRNETKRLS